MKTKTKKLLKIITNFICGLIGCKYPKLEETIEEVIEEVKHLNDEELNVIEKQIKKSKTNEKSKRTREKASN